MFKQTVTALIDVTMDNGSMRLVPYNSEIEIEGFYRNERDLAAALRKLADNIEQGCSFVPLESEFDKSR